MIYVLRRLLHGAIVVLAVAIFVFVLVRLTGDPIALMLGQEATPEDIAQLREQLGLDRSIVAQLGTFLGDLARGDLGSSIRFGEPALDLILRRMPATVELAAASLAIVLAVGVPLGLVAGLARDSVRDVLASTFALLGQSVPNFWLGIMLILGFSVNLGWFPASGGGGARHLVLPAITLAAYTTAVVARLQRSTVLDVQAQDHVRTAHAKGLHHSQVVRKHVLRNASIPVATVIGLQVPVLFGGAIVTETVFSYPGMGLLAIQAISNRDFPVVQAFVIVTAVLVVVVNLLVDLLYRWLDPRIRYA